MKKFSQRKKTGCVQADGKEAVSYTHLDVYKRQYELIRAHAEGNGDSKKQGDQVRKTCLCGIGEIVQNAAFTEQISERQEAHQGYGGGSDQSDDKGYDDGEQDPCGLGNRP